MRGLALATFAFLTASLSGCAGDDGPAAVAPMGDPAGTAAVAGAWSTETHSGDFVTTNAVYPGGLTGDTNPFEVPEGALEAWFNITIAGALPGDVDVRFNEPGCDQPSCIEDRPAAGGKLAVHYDEPEGGTWDLIFFAPGGAQQGTYKLDVTVRTA